MLGLQVLSLLTWLLNVLSWGWAMYSNNYTSTWHEQDPLIQIVTPTSIYYFVHFSRSKLLFFKHGMIHVSVIY